MDENQKETPPVRLSNILLVVIPCAILILVITPFHNQQSNLRQIKRWIEHVTPAIEQYEKSHGYNFSVDAFTGRDGMVFVDVDDKNAGDVKKFLESLHPPRPLLIFARKHFPVLSQIPIDDRLLTYDFLRNHHSQTRGQGPFDR